MQGRNRRTNDWRTLAKDQGDGGNHCCTEDTVKQTVVEGAIEIGRRTTDERTCVIKHDA